MVARAVVGGQQPPRAALLGPVQGVAGYALHHLGEQGVGVAREQIAEAARAQLGGFQVAGRNAERLARDLRHGAAEGGFVAIADDSAHGALAANGGGLHLTAVAGDDQQGDHGPMAREVGEGDIVPRLEQYLAAPQLDDLQVRLNDRELARGDGAEQPIGPAQALARGPLTTDRDLEFRHGGYSRPVRAIQRQNGQACCIGKATVARYF
jgi:hypothetical protein